MSTNHERFTVGDIECVALCDGTLPYPPNWFFSNAATEDVETELRARQLPTDHVLSSYTCLLVRTGKECVLVDTGAGGLVPGTGQLPQKLQELGVSPQQVTAVLLTHGHPDHIGGVLDKAGKPAFPSARYVMSRTEYNFWMGAPSLDRLALEQFIKDMMLNGTRRSLPPLKAQLELVDVEAEIVPGVRALAAPGHTPGHIAVLLSSGKEQLLHVADAVLHPVHLAHPEWRAAFDLDPEIAGATRQKLLDWVAADRVPVHAYHFPFPGHGAISKRGLAWDWEPQAEKLARQADNVA
ncbi:MAG TPA: MBL fold metallo-hydrolase [Terriglobales bacterium]|nr:MBL fold metallo-hydrolase [Terriglobales bacterium]